jgi:hypothetical protein
MEDIGIFPEENTRTDNIATIVKVEADKLKNQEFRSSTGATRGTAITDCNTHTERTGKWRAFKN